jgi:hypothetical protein
MYWYVIIFTNSICWNEALQAIEEASTGTVADDVNQLRAQTITKFHTISM